MSRIKGNSAEREMFLGTKQENNQDMINKGRFRAASGEFNGRKKHPERWPVGESIHCSKLTTTDVIEIRAKYSTEKTSYVKLANQYGVGKTTIERIVKGRKWKHVK